MTKSSKLLILTVLASILTLAFSTPGAFVFSDENSGQLDENSGQLVEAGVFHLPAVGTPADPSVRAIEAFLERYKVQEGERGRIATAIVKSGKKYDVDPRLIASVMIVESRANPFAISGADAVGIMQVHLPTWGHRADKEGINLFKIEDNVEFGVRILKDYVHRFGLWEGVKRYNGFYPENPASGQSATEYVGKVQHIYDHNSETEQALE